MSSTEKQQAQYRALVEELAKLGLTPEDVPSALQNLRAKVKAELSKVREKTA